MFRSSAAACQIVSRGMDESCHVFSLIACAAGHGIWCKSQCKVVSLLGGRSLGAVVKISTWFVLGNDFPSPNGLLVNRSCRTVFDFVQE